MLATVLSGSDAHLAAERRPDAEPGPGEVHIRVEACTVCRTDLHIIDGDLPPRSTPSCHHLTAIFLISKEFDAVVLRLDSRSRTSCGCGGAQCTLVRVVLRSRGAPEIKQSLPAP